MTGWLCNSLRSSPDIPILAKEHLRIPLPEAIGKEAPPAPILATWEGFLGISIVIIGATVFVGGFVVPLGEVLVCFTGFIAVILVGLTMAAFIVGGLGF